MTDYKLVPAVPTAEMLQAACDEEQRPLPMWTRIKDIYTAMLAAAPAVQGEPVATIHVDGSFVHVAWRISAPSRCAMDVYTAPQPTEQHPAPHPDDAAVDRFAAAMKAKLNKKRQEGRGGWQSMTAEQLSALLHEHVRKGDPVDVANLAMMLHQNGQRIEQQPAPDVAGLVVLLEHAQCPNCDGSGARHDNYGEPEQCQWCYERAEALAAHRKQGGEV